MKSAASKAVRRRRPGICSGAIAGTMISLEGRPPKRPRSGIARANTPLRRIVCAGVPGV
jgi:hypothetical protein